MSFERRMIVYLVWAHQHYEPSYLMGIYATEQKAKDVCDHYTLHEDNTEIWYDVKEEGVIT